MGDLRPHRPSHATVVAYLALFVALGGSGYAATKGGGDQAKSVTGKQAATVKQKGKQARRGPLAKRAQTRTVAAGGGAHALISKTGALSRSHNVASVSKPDVGVYCVMPAPGIDPTKAVPVVTPDFATDSTGFNQPGGNDPTSQAIVEARSSNFYNCPGGFPVITGRQRPDGKRERSDEPFFFSVPGGGPRAFTHINSAGKVNLAESQGISQAAVTQVGSTRYCIDLPFAPRNVTATVDNDGRAISAAVEIGARALSGCPGETASVRIDTYRTDSEGRAQPEPNGVFVAIN